MSTLSIVPNFDVLKDVRSCLRSRVVDVVSDQLRLKCREEALDDGVIPTIALSAHAADDARLTKLLLVGVARVLTSTVKYSKRLIERAELEAYKARTQPDGAPKPGRPKKQVK